MNSPGCKKRCVSVPAVNGPKTLQNQQGFSRFGRPKSAPIVHRKHAGTVPLPHRCRAASATRAGVRIVMTLQPMLLNRDVLALDDWSGRPRHAGRRRSPCGGWCGAQVLAKATLNIKCNVRRIPNRLLANDLASKPIHLKSDLALGLNSTFRIIPNGALTYGA